MPDFRIVVEGTPNRDWNNVAELVFSASRYGDGKCSCHKCHKTLDFRLENGAFKAECCSFVYRAAEAR